MILILCTIDIWFKPLSCLYLILNLSSPLGMAIYKKDNLLRQRVYKSIIGFLPTLGILIFGGLYVYSSSLYPGGSQADLCSEGFDWVHNYWCNLMNIQGMNGQLNPARPFAIFAMVVLCISLMLFFIRFAKNQSTSHFWKISIQLCGVISMVFAMFVFTAYHDLMTILSSVFGVIVVIGISWEVYKSKMHFFKLSGFACILLLGLNNYIYYTQHLIEYLPFIQKATFVLVLVWVMMLNHSLTKKIKNGRR